MPWYSFALTLMEQGSQILHKSGRSVWLGTASVTASNKPHRTSAALDMARARAAIQCCQ